jgi:glycosyltransferase involved in cell wall biosynthesis
MHLVIVDDGSTLQETIEFLQDLKSKHQVTIIKNETNLGVAASLNRGLSQIQEVDYLFRFDSDDVNLPKRI